MSPQRFTVPRTRRDPTKAAPPPDRRQAAMSLLRRWLLRRIRLPRGIV
jgi:hypothetical protein